MLHKLIPVAGAGLLLGLALVSCSDRPVPEYRFTSEQLAWQPYRVGDVLRFGPARSSKVRTFTVTEVDDRLETHSQGGNAPVYLGPPSKSRTQAIDVRMRRTDTLRYVLSPTSTLAKPDTIPYMGTETLLGWNVFDEKRLSTQVYWEIGFSGTLPLNQLTDSTIPPDTTLFLPTLRLGGISYGPVVRLTNYLPLSPLPINYGRPRARPARLVYYAKGYGVVGFVEGSTLWYRLP